MNRHTFKHILNKLVAFSASRQFYLIIVGLFIFEAVWIAFSAVYPQAFDENFHFGLIKVYSHYWLPFLSSQPPHADAYGAVARDPSYLYHYLMSFPYRLLALFTHSQTLQVIGLRLIDIGFFVTGIQLFKRVLQRMGISSSTINICTLLFILIPIVPQLAAQVSYDDLLFPLVAWGCLLTFQFTDELRQHRPTPRTLLTLTSVALFATMVKYAFLPFLLSIVLFVGLIAFRAYRHDGRALLNTLRVNFLVQPKWAQLLLPAAVLVLGVLFVQRDVVNFVTYHSVVPDCSKVLNVQRCSAYSPWQVDYARHLDVLSGRTPASSTIVSYTLSWFYFMWYRLFFAINGVASNFANKPPLPVPSLAAAALTAICAVAVVKWRRRIFYNNPYISFLLLVSFIYISSLFLKAYSTYRYTATLENMNGRYLIPVLLPIAATSALALSLSLKRFKLTRAALTIVVVALFLQGGGLLTFILRSDASWYWPNSTVIKVNNTARTITKHVVIKSG